MFDLARVDLDELVMALSDQDVGEHQWLIDPATGSIHVWSDDVGLDGDDRVDAEDLDEARLRAIEPIASRDWYRLMADFADQVSDTAAQAELGSHFKRVARSAASETYFINVTLTWSDRGGLTSRPAATSSRLTGSAAKAWST